MIDKLVKIKGGKGGLSSRPGYKHVCEPATAEQILRSLKKSYLEFYIKEKKMNSIKFSHDWNGKLSKGAGIFTTIRKSDPKKNDYYGERIGEIFVLILNGKAIGEATLVDIWSCQFSDLNPPLLMVDTGYKEQLKIEKLFNSFKIGKKDRVIVLVFDRIS